MIDRRTFLRLTGAGTVLSKWPRLALADDTLNLDSLKSKRTNLRTKLDSIT